MNETSASPFATSPDSPPQLSLPASPPERLAATFARIHAERMQGVFLLNPALRVEAVGFRRWEGRWLGVLITPWFMNLVLLPDDPALWRPVALRASLGYALPAGVFDFQGAFEEGFGDYQICSLFSPMFEFADQAAARMTALAALQALFDPAARSGPEGPVDLADPRTPPRDPSPASPASPAQAAHPLAHPLDHPPVAVAPDLDPPPAAPPAVSKRDFLRGRWARPPAQTKDR